MKEIWNARNGHFAKETLKLEKAQAHKPVYTSFPDVHMNFPLAQLQALSICPGYGPRAPQAFVLLFFVLGDLTSMMNVSSKYSWIPEHVPHVPGTRPVLTLLAQVLFTPCMSELGCLATWRGSYTNKLASNRSAKKNE